MSTHNGDRRHSGRRLAKLAASLAILLSPSAAFAGPPFLTDDPEPTDTGHWEIYAPLIEAEGRGDEFDVATGTEINFGAAKDLQLTLGVPVAWSHDASGWRNGVGDIEMSAKYRFINDETNGIQVAAFPGISLPTASNGMGAGRVTALLPIWFQKDSGNWSVFGGGGYAINPGAGNRDYWTGGIAVTRQFNNSLMMGIEIERQGADVIGGDGSTSLGLGAIYKLKAPFRLLVSGGPTIEDQTHKTGFHAFLALGIDY
jgi:Putative MetA-pathway of phenol degradation